MFGNSTTGSFSAFGRAQENGGARFSSAPSSIFGKPFEQSCFGNSRDPSSAFANQTIPPVPTGCFNSSSSQTATWSSSANPGGLFGRNVVLSNANTFNGGPKGTSTPSFAPRMVTEATNFEPRRNTWFQSISAMPFYERHSFEELRLQDYQQGRRPQQHRPEGYNPFSAVVSVANISPERSNPSRVMADASTVSSANPTYLVNPSPFQQQRPAPSSNPGGNSSHTRRPYLFSDIPITYDPITNTTTPIAGYTPQANANIPNDHPANVSQSTSPPEPVASKEQPVLQAAIDRYPYGNNPLFSDVSLNGPAARNPTPPSEGPSGSGAEPKVKWGSDKRVPTASPSRGITPRDRTRIKLRHYKSQSPLSPSTVVPTSGMVGSTDIQTGEIASKLNDPSSGVDIDMPSAISSENSADDSSEGRGAILGSGPPVGGPGRPMRTPAAHPSPVSTATPDLLTEDGSDVAKREAEGEYWMSPPLAILKTMTPAQLKRVEGLEVGRTGYGKVRFLETVDLSGLSSVASIPGEVVSFESRVCTIFPEEECKPPPGKGLNTSAIITINRCWPTDQATGMPIREEIAGDGGDEVLGLPLRDRCMDVHGKEM
ncbi:Nucleoporin2-domain-containing protein [Basidiobolus meristosporus CBS 931.73]|uniref:Nucleoporin2-domain-containing protein n=1 Tax=Basidiobolus meristosporus CBS 931.73 TaxID=1314790 RepID=A0A1Y1Y842_9FUNG|nr:Nucleoporin2-domain-containing protein [Basidiobolus meristosporus CBS 931.73]|eukprot:ORX93896.1 Nucleoporin2-domain-containing protein [Basidiobolus meristosporus CBS 931.73]